MSSKKKNPPGMWCRSVWIEYLSQRNKTVKKAVPVEEPSSDDDTADRISPSAMLLKKRTAKETVQEEEQLSDDGSSDSSQPNLEKFIFLSPSHTFTVFAPVELRFTPIYQIVAHRHDS